MARRLGNREARNTSGYGPVSSTRTERRCGELDNKIHQQHLHAPDTQEYSIPVNASARLSFRSWVCTEANWDGGGVSISTDGGQNWWWLPPQLNGFHDQISTVNTNSPLFGEGIIDGSSVPNGCGPSNTREFELKTYDLSNLSGQSLKARFSFFSDTYIEGDGWYIDDAGIEIDVFEPSGHWVSSSISPDALFGYGWLDGWYERPTEHPCCSTSSTRSSSPSPPIRTSRCQRMLPSTPTSTLQFMCVFGWPPTTPT